MDQITHTQKVGQSLVKSSQHFFAGFSPIASEIIHLSGPGAVTPDFTIIPYTKRDGIYWPKVDNPFASD
jgi:microcystin degradation protein MlrC